MKQCIGCEDKMFECYKYQQLGYDTGLEFVKSNDKYKEHCFVFVLNKKGKFIIK